jgi:tRNA 2-thiouridine synthesizing protein A
MTVQETTDAAVVLDNRGLEPPQPMMRILEALETLPDGATLLAINEREPLFLYPELAARGYVYETTPHPDGSFHIAIGRGGAAPEGHVAGQGEPARPAASEQTVVVDVRAEQRRHKEPFQRIMAAVEALGPADELIVVNTFEPVPLYTVLGRRGFAHAATQVGPEEWRVRFWRGQSDEEPRP